MARRDALSGDDRARASEYIADAALAVIAARVPAGAIVALYAAKGSEVATDALDAHLRARGYAVAYPRVQRGDRALTFHLAAAGELVADGAFGLREPSRDAAPVATSALAAVCVPGLAFDRAGGRLGWGRGHYDATLAATPTALRVGLAFAAQIIDAVPAEPHDVPLQVIATEDGAIEVGH